MFQCCEFLTQDTSGATQNVLTYLARSLERHYTHRQLRRNAPYPHARRIHSRLMMPS
jgi:hypothetical protein